MPYRSNKMRAPLLTFITLENLKFEIISAFKDVNIFQMISNKFCEMKKNCTFKKYTFFFIIFQNKYFLHNFKLPIF